MARKKNINITGDDTYQFDYSTLADAASPVVDDDGQTLVGNPCIYHPTQVLMEQAYHNKLIEDAQHETAQQKRQDQLQQGKDVALTVVKMHETHVQNTGSFVYRASKYVTEVGGVLSTAMAPAIAPLVVSVGSAAFFINRKMVRSIQTHIDKTRNAVEVCTNEDVYDDIQDPRCGQPVYSAQEKAKQFLILLEEAHRLEKWEKAKNVSTIVIKGIGSHFYEPVEAVVLLKDVIGGTTHKNKKEKKRNDDDIIDTMMEAVYEIGDALGYTHIDESKLDPALLTSSNKKLIHTYNASRHTRPA